MARQHTVMVQHKSAINSNLLLRKSGLDCMVQLWRMFWWCRTGLGKRNSQKTTIKYNGNKKKMEPNVLIFTILPRHTNIVLRFNVLVWQVALPNWILTSELFKYSLFFLPLSKTRWPCGHKRETSRRRERFSSAAALMVAAVKCN